jgi:hypothetical protein
MAPTMTHAPIALEPASQEFVEATSNPPFLYELTPAEARKVLDDVQAAPSDTSPVEDRVTTVRYDGITHDFMMLSPLSDTRATRAAVAQAIATLRDALHGT